MNSRSLPAFLASAPASALPGSWKLARGRAITLRPTADGIVRVAHGRVWATVEGPHGCTPDDAGDQILEMGEALRVRAGQAVVMEAWNASGASYFTWDPVCAAETAARPRLNFAGVLQPLADLRMASGIALRAAGQLATGLAHLAWDAARGGRRVPGARAA